MKSHRDKEGLLGPVHTVRMHVTKLPAKIERPDTSGQTLERMITFDSEGRKTEETTYAENGAIHSRKVYVRDAAQHTGWITYDSNGSLLERLVCQHDPDRKTSEHLTYGADGKLQQRQAQDYDKDNRRCDEATYTADGTLMWKHSTIYDDQHRVIEARFYVPNEATEHEGKRQENRTIFTYDDSADTLECAYYNGGAFAGRFVLLNPEGPTSQVINYDGAGAMQSRETIERFKFDDHGNWTEERVSTWVVGASKTESTELEPTELHHRTITYYREPKPGSPIHG
jgi:antitoxin component YwqK of YwqJK toxin-antitoxin module